MNECYSYVGLFFYLWQTGLFFFLRGSNLIGCRHFSLSPVCKRANEKLLTGDNSGPQSDVAQPLPPGNRDSGDSAAAERRAKLG